MSLKTILIHIETEGDKFVVHVNKDTDRAVKFLADGASGVKGRLKSIADDLGKYFEPDPATPPAAKPSLAPPLRVVVPPEPPTPPISALREGQTAQ